MSNYGIIVRRTGDLAGTIKIIRKHSTRSISEIKQGIDTGRPVLSIDSFDGPVDLSLRDRVRRQHEVLCGVIDDLRQNGDEIEVWHWVRDWKDDRAVSDEMLQNLMRSQLAYLEQKHD